MARPEPPLDLQTTEGRRAFDRACDTLEADGRDPAAIEEPLRRYARAADVAAKVREEWIADGSPATTLGGVTGKLLVVHPMVKAQQEVAEVANRLWRDLIYPPRRGQVGRPRGSASAPDRAAAPPRLQMFEGGGGA